MNTRSGKSENKVVLLDAFVIILCCLCSCGGTEKNILKRTVAGQIVESKTEGASRDGHEYVETFTDQFGATLKSEQSQSVIERKVRSARRKEFFDFDKEGVLSFHNYFFEYPLKLSFASSQSETLLHFTEAYKDAELGFDGNGLVNWIKFSTAKLLLANGITIGSEYSEVKAKYPDGFEYPDTSSSQEAVDANKNYYYFLKITRYGGGDGIVFHLDENRLVDSILIGSVAFAP